MPMSKATAEATRKAKKAVERKMSRMRKFTKVNVIAILAADFHLQHSAPIARSAEPDWYGAMLRPLLELQQLVNRYDAPLVVAGDIFDKPNPPPELIHFAMEWMPTMFAVPGQHDLMYHRYEDLNKTAYGVLVKAKGLWNLPPGEPENLNGEWAAVGFPWKHKIKKKPKDWEGGKAVCVAHQYIFDTGKNSFPGAKGHYTQIPHLNTYDVCVFGDNHKPFSCTLGKDTKIFNCGSLMCRHTDERDHSPRVGLLREDGTIESHYLDTSADKWLSENDMVKKVAEMVNLPELVDEFKKLAGKATDFLMELQRVMREEGLGEDVKEVLVRAIQKAKEKK